MSTIEAFAWVLSLLFLPVLVFAWGREVGRREVGRVALHRLARRLVLSGHPPTSAFVTAKTILDTPSDGQPKSQDAQAG